MSRSAGEEEEGVEDIIVIYLPVADGLICSSAQSFSVSEQVCVARVQRERAELEQNFAREISNLVQRLSTDKDQLEAELKLKLDQEVMLVRWVQEVHNSFFTDVKGEYLLLLHYPHLILSFIKPTGLRLGINTLFPISNV